MRKNVIIRLMAVPKNKKNQDIYEEAIKKTTNTPMDEEAEINMKI